MLLPVLAVAAPSLPRAEPLDEAAPMLACPECGPITAAVATLGGIVAVGERGLIVRGADGGGWRQVPSPVRRMLTAVTGTVGGRLVAVGHDALVLSSAGPGSAWTVVRKSPELDAPLLDIWIAGNGKGFAVGAYGLALTTENHGRDWTRRRIDPKEPHFYAIREAPNGALFIVGEFGTVLRSRDGGGSWARMAAGWDGTFFGLRAGHAGRLLIYGLEGALLESRDGGETWRRLESDVSAALYDAAFLPDGRAVVVGADGTVLVESGAGGFGRIARPPREAVAAVLATGPASVLLFGEGGVDRLILPPGSGGGVWGDGR